MRRHSVCACVLSGLAAMGLAAPALAATTEEVLGKITANEGVVKSFEADIRNPVKLGDPMVKMTEMVTTGGVQALVTTGHVAVQVIIKDGKRTGSLMNFKDTMKLGGMERTSLLVNDGEFVWSEMRDSQGEARVVAVFKNKIGLTGRQTGDTSVLRDRYDLKLVGEEEFDGQKMWILEGTPKIKADAEAAALGQPEIVKVRIDIGQKDLMTHRIRSYDKAGNEMSDMQFSNLKINPKLDPVLFKYTPPEGATVMDMTKEMPDFGGVKGMPKGMPKKGPPPAPPSGE